MPNNLTNALMTTRKTFGILVVVSAFCLFMLAPAAAKTIKLDVKGNPVENRKDTVPVEMVRIQDEVVPLDSARVTESFFPEKSRNLSKSHFTWGAEVGSTIDLTSNNLSTFDVDALFGYKSNSINMLGVGAGIHHSISAGHNFVPVYAVLQTSFTSRPSIAFFVFKGGYSFNTFKDSPSFGDIFGDLGIGVNLKRTRMMRSYLMLCFGYHHLTERQRAQTNLSTKNIFVARLSFGINF